MKNLEELKDTVLDIIKGTLGKPMSFNTLVRSARAANPSFSYYSWDYGVVLQQLETEGSIKVDRSGTRLKIEPK